MTHRMQTALKVLVVPAALVALIGIWGSRLPVAHTARRSIQLQQPPAKVWSMLTDYANQPAWRTELTAVEHVAGSIPDTWTEVTGNERIPYATTESDAPRRLVRTIADRTLPYGGRWVYELEPVEGGTRLTITEEGEVYNPVFRFISHYFLDQTATIQGVMRSLATHLGESADIQ